MSRFITTKVKTSHVVRANSCFFVAVTVKNRKYGLMQIKLSEPVKLEVPDICYKEQMFENSFVSFIRRY